MSLTRLWKSTSEKKLALFLGRCPQTLHWLCQYITKILLVLSTYVPQVQYSVYVMKSILPILVLPHGELKTIVKSHVSQQSSLENESFMFQPI